MDLHTYFTMLRRRWVVIVLLTVIGAGLGVASTALDSGGEKAKAGRTYYKATDTLLMRGSDDESGTFPSAFTNLDQIAVLTTTGPIPDAAAVKIGGGENGRLLAERITTVTNGTANTLSITAIAPSGDEAVKLADTFSSELLANLTATDLERYNQANQDASDRLNAIQAKIDTLFAQVAALPPGTNTDLQQAQLRALNNQYSSAYDDFERIASQQAPTNPLSTLQKAQAVPIGAAEYNTRLAQGQLGQNNLQAGSTAATVTSATVESSSLTGTVPRGVLGALLGFLFGAGLALMMERLDRRIRTRADAEGAFGLAVLAEVPELTKAQQGSRAVLTRSQPLSTTAEAYRSVRSAILFQMATAQATTPGARDPFAEIARRRGGRSLRSLAGTARADGDLCRAQRGQDDVEREPRSRVRRGGSECGGDQLRLPPPDDPPLLRRVGRGPEGAPHPGCRHQGDRQRDG